MKKVFTRANLVIFLLFSLALALAVFAFYQILTINGKKQLLNELQSQSVELSQEIEQAKETLEVVSSLEYQENRARINGYAYPDEKRFIAKN